MNAQIIQKYAGMGDKCMKSKRNQKNQILGLFWLIDWFFDQVYEKKSYLKKINSLSTKIKESKVLNCFSFFDYLNKLDSVRSS